MRRRLVPRIALLLLIELVEVVVSLGGLQDGWVRAGEVYLLPILRGKRFQVHIEEVLGRGIHLIRKRLDVAVGQLLAHVVRRRNLHVGAFGVDRDVALVED